MRIITGCSRSGTSFLCQFLARLGADFGPSSELVAADEWNRRGYFENRGVNTLNHRLLFGGWSRPELWVDVMWPRAPWVRARKLATLAAAPLLTGARQIRARGDAAAADIGAHARANRGRCVKDPRFCYLMEPWLRHGEIESVLFALRHPWESAGSMSRQTGLPLALTYRGWLDSVRRFWEPLPDGVPVHIVDYNAFFDPGTQTGAAAPLFEFLGRPFDPTEAQTAVEASLDSKLRTKRAPEVRLPRAVAEWYESLLQKAASRGGCVADSSLAARAAPAR